MKKTIFYRTRFGKDIVAEWLPPLKKSRRVMIICDGMPTVPKKREELEFWSKRGYWVFHPRYRGSWESGGEFLKISPERDILQVVDGIDKGFIELWSGRRIKVKPKNIYLLGGSFGGAAVILASRDKRVTAGVAFSPVVDWQVSSPTEPLDKLYTFVKKAFGQGYRLKTDNWRKLSMGNFYNPVKEASMVMGDKLLLLHAYDDKVVDWRSVKKFAKSTGCSLRMFRGYGHGLGTKQLEPGFTKIITNFFESKTLNRKV